MENMDIDDENVEDSDGCIHSIHVRNFFCHDNLLVKLNRNVNFIVGRNGSGKSAVLTALIVGLGGRASATNRGSSLTSFIKKGQNSATIEIKIKNSSSTAYKHHLYGDFITIVRTLNASGGSSYKVKSATGEVISTKYEEVSSIVLAHDIQVDNPISVLNQDDARSFHASDAKKKYALFRKATNLDLTEGNYNWALENCNKAKAVWKKKTDACVDLEKEYKKWKTSHEQLKSRDETEALKKRLQDEYYWSEIADYEKEANTIQAQCDKQKAKMARQIEKLKQMENSSGINNDAIQALKTQLEEKTQQRTALEQELRAMESEIREVQATQRSTQNCSGKQREQMNREQKKVADLEREIRSIESGSAADERAELESAAEAAQAALAAAEARYNTAQNDAAQARQNLAHAVGQAEQMAARAHRQRDSIRQLKQQLRELESRGNDSLAVYGNHMVELAQRVKQAVAQGEFSAPPRGPVGSYLKVKEKRWGGALEHIIGGSMRSFCVNSPEDSRKLFQIMGQVFGSAPKPSVTCSKFLSKMHDVRRNKVRASGFHSALESIDVADAVVANFLIDQIGLESILLVPEHDDAVRLSDNEENVPENCSKIVTLDSSEYYPAPNYRSYGGAHKQSQLLQVGTAQRKKQVKQEITEAESALQALEAQAEALSGEASQAQRAEAAAKKALQALHVLRHEKSEAVRQATAALQERAAPHHAVLVEELNLSKEKLRTLQAQVDAATGSDRDYRRKIDAIEAKMKLTKGHLKEAMSTLRSLTEEIDQEQNKLDQGVTESRTLKQWVREERIKVTQVEAILEEKRGNISKKEQEALMLCGRIDNPRDKAVVTNELKKTQLKLSSIRSDGLTKTQVAEKLLAVERKYRRTKLTLDKLKKLIDLLHPTITLHLGFCKKLQDYISRHVQHAFQSILMLRDYSGSMNIDHANGVLEISCTGRESSGKRVASTTSSLSGGERSYSTVAFIMALWGCVEVPFYFMDEFDVFMDNVNRKIVMDLLIDHALKHRGHQFAFLTPQDASAVHASPLISIHLLITMKFNKSIVEEDVTKSAMRSTQRFVFQSKIAVSAIIRDVEETE